MFLGWLTFGTGVTIYNFRKSGHVPHFRALFITIVIGLHNLWANALRTLAGTSVDLEDLLTFKSSKTSSTSSSLKTGTSLSSKYGKFILLLSNG